jgi:hypothetical protein
MGFHTQRQNRIRQKNCKGKGMFVIFSPDDRILESDSGVD